MFFFLISHILSLSCTHKVTAVNQPMSYTFDVDEGEYICINSTLPYVTVVFHNSIIKARYFLHSNIDLNIESGNFLFPAEKGGISFGSKKGSMDIMALLPGNVSFSVFSFPPICIGRYVSTKQSKDIILKDEFGEFRKGFYCIWYPQSKYDVTVSELPEDPDSVSLCEKDTDCRDPFASNRLVETVKTPSFFKMHAHTIDFYKHFQLSIESTSKRPLIPFDMEGVIDITQVTLFDVSAPKDVKNKKKEDNKQKEEEEIEDKNIDEDFEKNEKEEQNEVLRRPPLEIPPRHDNRRSSRKEISPGEIMAMVVVVCGIIVTFITCFLCGGSESLCKQLNSFRGKNRFIEDENRQSEARLLGNGQGRQPMMVAMMPVYSAQNQQQQMPLTGVYFPPITSDESANAQAANNSNNMQNMQPQPLLLLPNPSAQNPNQAQQNQQPGVQPQYYYPQQYYPQYAFVQPQQGYPMPQMQNAAPPSTTPAATNLPTNTTADANSAAPTNQ